MSDDKKGPKPPSRAAEVRDRNKALAGLPTDVCGLILMVGLFVWVPWPGKLATVPFMLMFLAGLAGELLVIVTTSRRLRDLD